jgi:hypothetical protein
MDEVKDIRLILSNNSTNAMYEVNTIRSLSRDYSKAYVSVEKFQVISDPAHIPASTHLYLLLDQSLNATYSNIFSNKNSLIPSRILDSFLPTSFHYDNTNAITKYIYDFQSKSDNYVEVLNNVLDSSFSVHIGSQNFTNATEAMNNVDFSFVVILKFQR